MANPARVCWMHRVLVAGYRLQVAVIDDVAELAEWLRTHEHEGPTKLKPMAVLRFASA